MSKKKSPKMWMRVLGKEDAVHLHQLLSKRHPAWADWECKALRDNIIVYVPDSAWDQQARTPDASDREMIKMWRVVPAPGGPFGLEYMRHTGQWWPLLDAVGDLAEIVKRIEREAEMMGFTKGDREKKKSRRGAQSGSSGARKKKTAEPSPLREVVGDVVYDAWLDMLRELVPEGRTHRLAVVVASMLMYALRRSWSRPNAENEDDPAFPLVVACEGLDEEEMLELLTPMLARFFKDAGVKHERVSSRGERYSILWHAIIEFNRWEDYPWE